MRRRFVVFEGFQGFMLIFFVYLSSVLAGFLELFEGMMFREGGKSKR